MSDIVERARKYSPYEIVSAENKRLQLQCSQWEITVNQKDAEIERLRAALTAIKEGSVSGHIDYTPVREFIRRELTK